MDLPDFEPELPLGPVDQANDAAGDQAQTEPTTLDDSSADGQVEHDVATSANEMQPDGNSLPAAASDRSEDQHLSGDHDSSKDDAPTSDQGITRSTSGTSGTAETAAEANSNSAESADNPIQTPVTSGSDSITTPADSDSLPPSATEETSAEPHVEVKSV